MSGFTASGIATSTVTSDKQAPLGFELTTPNGDYGFRVWVYIQMTGGAAAMGDVIERTNGNSFIGAAGAVATTKSSCLGVAQHAIAADHYGFILKSGKGQVTCDGSVTVGVDIVPAAAADVTDMTGGQENRVIGIALATDTGAGTQVAAMIDCGT